MQHGAFDFLQKPYRDQDLPDRIAGALRKDADNRRQLLSSPLIREHFESPTPRARYGKDGRSITGSAGAHDLPAGAAALVRRRMPGSWAVSKL